MAPATRIPLRLVPEPGSLPPPAKASLDDSELLVALRAGDPSAATALYDRTHAVVTRTVAPSSGGRTLMPKTRLSSLSSSSSTPSNDSAAIVRWTRG